MKFVKSKVEILHNNDPFEMIELAGRTCYKSEDKITPGSALEFTQRMIDSKHYAMLEHGTIYLTFTKNESILTTAAKELRKDQLYNVADAIQILLHNPYTEYTEDEDNYYITTSYRVLLECKLRNVVHKFMVDPTPMHPRRITVKFICDRGVSHELVRHRKFSFAQESTRYCNYSKDKFGEELTFIDSPFEYAVEHCQESELVDVFRHCEETYMRLLEYGWKPEEARAVLPNALKTEVVMTGFVDDWQHFFDLRYHGVTGKPHPEMYKLAKELYELQDKQVIS